MRKLLVAAAVCGSAIFGMANDSEAGYRNYTICWESLSGGSDCASLPDDYHLKGIARPYCDRENRCKKGIVYFKLSHRLIEQLDQYVKTSTMRPYQTASIHAKHR